MAEVHQAATVTHVTNTNSGKGQTALQIAAGVGIAGPLASNAAEAAVKAGTLERIEGGTTGIRYAQPGKGV